ncbi:hypothetical protein [Massilia haematophila]|uniref:Uncharacterized protein n=1 Tax=Massilia haematophila TaxID=457923 RepID=A0ABV7PN86_9BURK
MSAEPIRIATANGFELGARLFRAPQARGCSAHRRRAASCWSIPPRR